MITNETAIAYADTLVERMSGPLADWPIYMDADDSALWSLAMGRTLDMAGIAWELRQISEMAANEPETLRMIDELNEWLTAQDLERLTEELTEPSNARLWAVIIACALVFATLIVLLTLHVRGMWSESTPHVSETQTQTQTRAQTYTWDEGDTNEVDLRPGDTLNLNMTQSGNMIARCQRLGGSSLRWQETLIVCTDVDF